MQEERFDELDRVGGFDGEGDDMCFALWLLIKGVRVEKWRAPASASAA